MWIPLWTVISTSCIKKVLEKFSLSSIYLWKNIIKLYLLYNIKRQSRLQSLKTEKLKFPIISIKIVSLILEMPNFYFRSTSTFMQFRTNWILTQHWQNETSNKIARLYCLIDGRKNCLNGEWFLSYFGDVNYSAGNKVVKAFAESRQGWHKVAEPSTKCSF